MIKLEIREPLLLKDQIRIFEIVKESYISSNRSGLCICFKTIISQLTEKYYSFSDLYKVVPFFCYEKAWEFSRLNKKTIIGTIFEFWWEKYDDETRIEFLDWSIKEMKKLAKTSKKLKENEEI